MLKDALTNIIKEEANTYLNSIDYYTQMNSIGSFGKIIFQVSTLETLSPNDYDIKVAPKLKEHSLINRPNITEYQGRELINVSFGLKLIYTLTNVSNAIDKLNEYCIKGHHFPLVLSGEKIGDNSFIITDFSRKITKTDKIGNPLVVECSLSLKEYISEMTENHQLQIQQKGTNPLEKKTIAGINGKVLQELSKVRLW